ncbi:MAG: MotA/TolQ/ExbB proton channel family protein [Akkermansiaceae bacterium]
MKLAGIFTEFDAVIHHGGIILWLMLGLSIVLYSTITSTWLGMSKLKLEIQRLFNHLDHDSSEAKVLNDLEIFELDRFAWVQRRIPVISVMIALAPLAGLLGTVSGMLNTFSGMASATHTKPIDSISSGISQALVTTQAGLLMAIPAALIFVLLKSRIQQIQHQLEQHAAEKIIQLKGGTK